MVAHVKRRAEQLGVRERVRFNFHGVSAVSVVVVVMMTNSVAAIHPSAVRGRRNDALHSSAFTMAMLSVDEAIMTMSEALGRGG